MVGLVLVDTDDLCINDMIVEYQPLILNTIVVNKVVPIKAQVHSHDKAVSFSIVVLYSAMSLVLCVAVVADSENGVITFLSGLM